MLASWTMGGLSHTELVPPIFDAINATLLVRKFHCGISKRGFTCPLAHIGPSTPCRSQNSLRPRLLSVVPRRQHNRARKRNYASVHRLRLSIPVLLSRAPPRPPLRSLVSFHANLLAQNNQDAHLALPVSLVFSSCFGFSF